MDWLDALTLIAAWILLGMLSNRFGRESRDRFYDPPAGAVWRLPGGSGSRAGQPGRAR